MKNTIFILLITILVVLVGTWPLGILAMFFELVAYGLRLLANVLNFFGWKGMI